MNQDKAGSAAATNSPQSSWLKGTNVVSCAISMPIGGWLGVLLYFSLTQGHVLPFHSSTVTGTGKEQG